MRRNPLNLFITTVFLGIIFCTGISIAFAEEVTEKKTSEKGKMEEFEKKLEKLTEDVENIIKNRMEEKGEMSE